MWIISLKIGFTYRSKINALPWRSTVLECLLYRRLEIKLLGLNTRQRSSLHILSLPKLIFSSIMSYVSVDLASGSRPKPRTQTGQHDGEEDFRGEVDLEKGCEALLELERYMSSEPIENAQLYTTQSHVKAPDDHVENISNLSKLRCELFAAREAGQLIGDEGFHTSR